MNTKKQRAIALLNEIIEAGQIADIPLNMSGWIFTDEEGCNTACCMCGDVAIARGGNDLDADRFSDELNAAFKSLTNQDCVFIYGCDPIARERSAKRSGLFSESELLHPHLTTNHRDRAVAHDFVRLVISKIEAMEDQP